MSQQISKLKLGTGFTNTGKPFSQVIQGHRGQQMVEQSDSYSFTPENGWTQTITYHAPMEILKTEAKKQIKDYKAKDYRVNVDISDTGGGFGTMTIRCPARLGDEKEFEDADTVNWTLTGNDMEKDILTHPHLTDRATEADFDILRQLKQDPSMTPPVIGDFDLPYGAYPYDISVLIRHGVETYSLSQWVLRKSSVLNSEATAKTEIGDVGKQFTKAQMTASESLPTELKFSIPDQGIWMKRTPTVSLEGTRYKIDGEFWHADYASTILYPVKT